MWTGLWLELLIGSCIILIPLGILILTIAIDLDSKEKRLTQRISSLERAYGLKNPRAKDPSRVPNETEIDMQDKEQIEKLVDEGKIKRNISKSLEAPFEDYSFAPEEIIIKINNDRLGLDKKIKNFKIYSMIIYALISVSLGILPLLDIIGFKWGWK